MKKNFRLIDTILAVVCITLVIESVGGIASLGNSQYFWWLFFFIFFFIPYGLISCELSSTYNDEMGLYGWVKRALGTKWASRVAWNYWINFPISIATTAIFTTNIVTNVFNTNLNSYILLGIQLIFIWLIYLLSLRKISDSKLLINLGAFFKVLIMTLLGLLGIYIFLKTGESVNPINSFKDLLPQFDLQKLSFLSVIIFNFLGFEIITSFIKNMKKPKRDIPIALIIGGIIIILFYLLSSLGINLSLTVEEAKYSGITQSFIIMLTKLGLSGNIVKIITIGIGLMIIYSMVSGIISWSHGVNTSIKYASIDKKLPKLFSIINKNNRASKTSLINSLIASFIVIVGFILGKISSNYSNLFWTFFSLSLVTFLISYVFMFISFLKLRKIDNTERVYRVFGNKIWIYIMTIIPILLLIISILITIFGDFSKQFLVSNLPLIGGLGLSILLQEIFINCKYK